MDTNPNSLSARGWLEDTSKVQKYTMSDEDYKARENTYWRYKEEKLKVSICSLLCHCKGGTTGHSSNLRVGDAVCLAWRACDEPMECTHAV